MQTLTVFDSLITLFNQILYLITNFSEFYISGIKITLLLAIVGTFGGTLIGFVIVIFRNVTIHFKDRTLIRILKKLSIFLTTAYIDIVRGTPMIVQAALFHYAIYANLSDNPNVLYSGLFVITLNTAAYIAEIIRSSINSLGENQIEAAQSLGLSRTQAMRYIILPQALKNSIPSLSNELIVNTKDSAVLSVIGVGELFNNAKAANSTVYFHEANYLLVAIIYFILTFSLSRILAYLIGDRSTKKISISSQTVPGGEK